MRSPPPSPTSRKSASPQVHYRRYSGAGRRRGALGRRRFRETFVRRSRGALRRCRQRRRNSRLHPGPPPPIPRFRTRRKRLLPPSTVQRRMPLGSTGRPDGSTSVTRGLGATLSTALSQPCLETVIEWNTAPSGIASSDWEVGIEPYKHRENPSFRSFQKVYELNCPRCCSRIQTGNGDR
jgi:hypothetical protein